MPLLLDLMRSGSDAESRRPNSICLGLVNNMPDAALEATERQFVELLRAAATHTSVHLELFAVPEVSRADHVRRELAERYHDISELWSARLDGLIVTGNEPRAANLREEPYWPALARLIDWAQENTASTIWSCLAAHAAVLHADGIERRSLAEKCFGIFDCSAVAAHPLVEGIAQPLPVPHSRHNDLAEQPLLSCGYRLLTRSATAGVDMFVKEIRRAGDLASCFVFFQGHPEYEADTLLREYRRDVGRFLRGEREHYPATPQGYFDPQATAIVNAFRDRAVADRDNVRFAEFPMSAIEAGLAASWRSFAVGIYKNWFEYLKMRKAARLEIAAPAQRSRHGGGVIGVPAAYP